MKAELKKSIFRKYNIIILLIIIGVTQTIIVMNKDISEREIVTKILNILPFLSPYLSIYSCNTITSEYSNHTIKMLLTKPKNRYKILLYKYLTIFILVVSILFIMLLVININLGFIENKKIILYFIPILFSSFWGLSIGVIVKSNILSYFIVSFIVVFSSLISNLLITYNFSIIEYTFLPYMDFSIFNNDLNILEFNSIYNVNLSLESGVFILFVFGIVFILFSLIVFNERDISN